MNRHFKESVTRLSASNDVAAAKEDSPLSAQSLHNGDGTVGPYYSDVGPGPGLVSYRDVAGSIDVFEDLDRAIPIGKARCIGWDVAGSAVWRLIVDGEELEEPWVIVDREFLTTRPAWRDLYRSDFHHDLNMRRSPSSARKRRGGGRPIMRGLRPARRATIDPLSPMPPRTAGHPRVSGRL